MSKSFCYFTANFQILCFLSWRILSPLCRTYFEASLLALTHLLQMLFAFAFIRYRQMTHEKQTVFLYRINDLQPFHLTDHSDTDILNEGSCALVQNLWSGWKSYGRMKQWTVQTSFAVIRHESSTNRLVSNRSENVVKKGVKDIGLYKSMPRMEPRRMSLE